MQTNQRGFIALMSVIVISAILLVLIFTLETASFFQRFDALDAENKRMSLSLAEACVQTAMLRIAQGTYTTGAVTVGTNTCTVCKADAAGDIATRAQYNGAYTNLSVSIDTTPGSYAITHWQETPSKDASCP